MKRVSVREARQALSRLDQLLSAEGEVTITRRGKPVARLVAMDRKRPIPSHRDLRNDMPRMRKGSERLIREDRDEK
jgi:antitoxin (DNA-binding transcriptional repressor) of toxin-antitoxin stability system